MWRYRGGRGHPVDRCRRHRDQRVDTAWAGCAAHTSETELDCLTCGACCREAYHAVEVAPRDPFVRLHPESLAKEDGRWIVRRTGDRCSNLVHDQERFTCRVYDDRPKTCRDFLRGGPHCVDARRRVGITP